MTNVGRRAWLRLALFGVLMACVPLTFLVGRGFADNYYGGPYHWGDGAGGMARVTIVDYTGPQWPVYVAHAEWDFAGRLDVDYHADTCGGREHCVGMAVSHNFTLPCRENGGNATLIPNQAGTHLSDESFARFNSRCAADGYTNRDRRALACEEMGHLLGLDHGGDPAYTCMASGWIIHLEETPREHDFFVLDERLYDHND